MIKKVLYVLLIIIGLIGILNTIGMSMISVGITIGTILPGLIGLCLIIFSLLKLTLKNKKIIRNEKFRKVFIIVFSAGLLFFLVIEGLIIGNYSKKEAPKPGADAVVVLGCGIFSDGTPTLSLQKRLNAAYDYLMDNPDAVCIVSGGQGHNEPYSEAKAMHMYLKEKGLDESRIILEDQSTSTSENLLYSDKILKQIGLYGDIAVATSDFHIFRTKFLANRYGMGEIIALPSDTAWYLWANVHLREFIAVMKSFILD